MCMYVHMCKYVCMYSLFACMYVHPIYMYVCAAYLHSLLHVECHSIFISNLNLIGFFSTERGKRDLARTR